MLGFILTTGVIYGFLTWARLDSVPSVDPRRALIAGLGQGVLLMLALFAAWGVAALISLAI